MKRGLFIASAAAVAVAPALPVKAVAADAYVYPMSPFKFDRALLLEWARMYEENFVAAGAVRAEATVADDCSMINCLVVWPAPKRFIITLKVGNTVEITPP